MFNYGAAISRLKTIRKLIGIRDRAQVRATHGALSPAGCLGSILLSAGVFSFMAVVVSQFLIQPFGSRLLNQVFAWVSLGTALASGIVLYAKVRAKLKAGAREEVARLDAEVSDAVRGFRQQHENLVKNIAMGDEDSLSSKRGISEAIQVIGGMAESYASSNAEQRSSSPSRPAPSPAEIEAAREKRWRHQHRKCPQCGSILRYGTNSSWPSIDVWWCSTTDPSRPGCGYEITPSTHPEEYPDFPESVGGGSYDQFA